MTSPLPLLVVGSVALDTVHTPAGERHEALGGSASYFALAAIRYAPVRMVVTSHTATSSDENSCSFQLSPWSSE